MAFAHKQPTDFEREYILGPDGVFYSREVVTTPITDQQQLVERCKFKQELIVPNNLSRFKIADTDESKEVEINYASGYFEGFYKDASSSKYVFVPINCFPFPKALIKLDQEVSVHNDEYKYTLHPARANLADERFKSTPFTPHYFNNYYQLFIMLPITQGRLSEFKNSFSTTAPYLFAVNKETKEPVVINLPNIFETGKICTGDDYAYISEETSLRGVVRKLLTELVTSPANTDLMPSQHEMRKHLTFNHLGALKHPSKEDSKVSDNGFFTPCDRGPIVDFCKTEACQLSL